MSQEPKEGSEHGVAVLPDPRASLKPPRHFRVLLHDDDFTTMDFAERVLQSVFGHDAEAARRIMLDVHRQGIGLAGIFPYEVAEAKAAKVVELARAEEFPFLATTVPDGE